MSENDGIDFASGDWQVLPVSLAPLFLSLKKAAVDQDLNPLGAGLVAGID